MDVWDYVIIISAAGLAIGWIIERVGDALINAHRHEHGQPSIEHLDVEAGDTVLVTLPRPWTKEQLTQFRDALKARLPEGVVALVVPAETTVTVLKPGEEP